MDNEALQSNIEELSRALVSLLGPLQIPTERDLRRLDELACNATLAAITSLAHLLKGQAQIPRIPLNDMRSAVRTLRAEAPYSGQVASRCIQMADQIEYLFDLILLGETPDDRRPGVPRIF